MVKNQKNNGSKEIGLVTPTPVELHARLYNVTELIVPQRYRIRDHLIS